MTTSPFNEAPFVAPVATVSSSIDTTAGDAYRQGVELTLDRYYQMGPVKIHAGEPRHELRPNTAGEPSDLVFQDTRFFEEIDVFDPVLYMTRNISINHLSYVVAFRASTVAKFAYDGIIEPFAIRTVVTFQSVNQNLEPHSIKGSVESANFNALVHADRVVSVQKFNEITLGSHPFEDNVDAIFDIPVNVGYFPMETRSVSPFNDTQLKSGQIVSDEMEDDLKARIREMSPETDNYIPFDSVNSTTGFDD